MPFSLTPNFLMYYKFASHYPLRYSMCNLIISPGRIHLGERCTLNDRFNSILYKHSVITQAAAATYPQGTISALSELST